MSSNYGFNTNSNVLKYLKKFGVKKRETPLISIEILKSNLIRGHSKSQLSTLKILLNTEVESKKHHHIIGTAIMIVSSALTTFFIYFFIFGSGFLTSVVSFVADKLYDHKSKEIENDEQFESLMQEASKIFTESLQALTKTWGTIFWSIIIVLCMLIFFFWFYYQRNYRHLQFYKNLIDECILEKEKEEKNLSINGE